MWLGACTSSIGTWMQILAQSWLVYRLSNSAFYLGLDTFFAQIPIFLFSLVGGVFADRHSRRTILLVSQFLQMACALILALVVALGVVQVWHILVLSFVVGSAQSFGGPAYSALVPSLVKKEDLQNAIALNSIQFNLARVVGPAIGGVALVKLGAAWCFTLNGLSFVAVIASLFFIRSSFVPPKTNVSILESMREGVSFMRHRQGMSSLITIAFLLTFLSFPLITFLPVIARDVFHGSEKTFTIFLSLSGAGSVLGALAVAASSRKYGTSQHALAIMLLLGVLITAIGISTQIVVSSILIFLAGIMLIIVFALNSSLVQYSTIDAMRGRVMSVYNVAFRGGMPFGSLMSGILIKKTSVPFIMSLNGLLIVILAIYFLSSRSRSVEIEDAPLQ